MQLTTLHTANRILASTRKLGIELPAPIAKAEQRAAAIASMAGDIMPKPGELIAALVAAVDSKKDPATDARVARALQGQALANDAVLQGLRFEAGTILAEALAEHHKDLIEAWRIPFDAAAEALVDAHSVLGDYDLADTSSIVRMGNKASDAWAVATKAVATITAISQNWGGWADVSRLASSDPSHSTLRIAEVDWDTWRSERLAGGINPWKLAQLGIDLDLADPDTYRARKAQHVEAQRAEAAAAEARSNSRGFNNR